MTRTDDLSKLPRHVIERMEGYVEEDHDPLSHLDRAALADLVADCYWAGWNGAHRAGRCARDDAGRLKWLLAEGYITGMRAHEGEMFSLEVDDDNGWHTVSGRSEREAIDNAMKVRSND